MSNYQKHITFKYLFIIALLLKISYAVFDTIVLQYSEKEAIEIVDFDDSNSLEKDLDEDKKIVEDTPKLKLIIKKQSSNEFHLIDNFVSSIYLDFTTPPPEYLFS